MHAARKLAKEFGEDPGKIMLKVDFSNAFNMANRTEMLAQVYEKLPRLYRGVLDCYCHRAHLFWVPYSASGCNNVMKPLCQTHGSWGQSNQVGSAFVGSGANQRSSW